MRLANAIMSSRFTGASVADAGRSCCRRIAPQSASAPTARPRLLCQIPDIDQDLLSMGQQLVHHVPNDPELGDRNDEVVDRHVVNLDINLTGVGITANHLL